MSELDNRPIGVFDSGIGGLTVLQSLMAQFPNENFVYIGDTARLPYGSKSPETIRKYSIQIIEKLISYDVKAIVIACNSASSQVQELNYKSIPLYNVITPGAKLAVKKTQNQQIVILGTRATIESHIYKNKILALNSKISVLEIPCPLFVPLAEEGLFEGALTELAIKNYLPDHAVQEHDTFVLGCTHYPLLKPTLIKLFPQTIFIDSGQAISEWMQTDQVDKIWQPSSSNSPLLKIFLTDQSAHFQKIAALILKNSQFKIEIINL